MSPASGFRIPPVSNPSCLISCDTIGSCSIARALGSGIARCPTDLVVSFHSGSSPTVATSVMHVVSAKTSSRNGSSYHTSLVMSER